VAQEGAAHAAAWCLRCEKMRSREDKLGFSVGRCLYIDIQRLWFIIAHPTVEISGPHRANPFSVSCRVPAHGPNARPRHGHRGGPCQARARGMRAWPCLGRAFPGRARFGPAGLAHLENYSELEMSK